MPRTEGTKISIVNNNGIVELHGKIKEVENQETIIIDDKYNISVSGLKEVEGSGLSFNVENSKALIKVERFIEIPNDQYRLGKVVYDADGNGTFKYYISATDEERITSKLERELDERTGGYINISELTPNAGYAVAGWSDGKTGSARRDDITELLDSHKDLYLKILYTSIRNVFINGAKPYVFSLNGKTKNSASDNIDFSEDIADGGILEDNVVQLIDGQGTGFSVKFRESQTDEWSNEYLVPFSSFKQVTGTSYTYSLIVNDESIVDFEMSDISNKTAFSFSLKNVKKHLYIDFTVE